MYFGEINTFFLSISIYVFCRDQYHLLESIYFQRSIFFVYVRSMFLYGSFLYGSIFCILGALLDWEEQVMI